MTANESYLESCRKQFVYYKMLGERAMDQLEEHQLIESANADTNSIAVIVKHLAGNMLSRWTDFLNSDGEKPWRNRDDEFESTISSRTDLIKVWDSGWSCLLQALESLTVADLDKIIYIRNEGHTVTEAINRQLAHYPYHIGQIVFYAKLLKPEPWQTLSIARNSSGAYNDDKFASEKARKHFTDTELNRLQNDTITTGEKPE